MGVSVDDVTSMPPLFASAPRGRSVLLLFCAPGRFLVRLSENGHLGNRYAPENFEHMAEKISPRYVEIRGLFGFRCT